MNASKKAINATADIIHLFGNMLTTAQQALWDSIVLNKKSLDFYTKTTTIFEGILSCSIPGTTSADVGRLVADMVPIAGA